ncbi:hypothetical protein JI435_045720, partial [Parastagonospora nodorum SN15]
VFCFTFFVRADSTVLLYLICIRFHPTMTSRTTLLHALFNMVSMLSLMAMDDTASLLWCRLTPRDLLSAASEKDHFFFKSDVDVDSPLLEDISSAGPIATPH